MAVVKWPAPTITSSGMYTWRAINSRTFFTFQCPLHTILADAAGRFETRQVQNGMLNGRISRANVNVNVHVKQYYRASVISLKNINNESEETALETCSAKSLSKAMIHHRPAVHEWESTEYLQVTQVQVMHIVSSYLDAATADG